MSQIQNRKRYDLEERTLRFAQRSVNFSQKLPKNLENIEIRKQFVRSTGSVAANYIEANEALSKKDFIMRIKICRKEAKESELWFKLAVSGNNNEIDKERQELIGEAVELRKIFGSILEKSK